MNYLIHLKALQQRADEGREEAGKGTGAGRGTREANRTKPGERQKRKQKRSHAKGPEGTRGTNTRKRAGRGGKEAQGKRKRLANRGGTVEGRETGQWQGGAEMIINVLSSSYYVNILFLCNIGIFDHKINIRVPRSVIDSIKYLLRELPIIPCRFIFSNTFLFVRF